MKKIIQKNGYIVYQAVTDRDTKKYGIRKGCYNVYPKEEIESYGVSFAYADFEDVDTLDEVMELIDVMQLTK